MTSLDAELIAEAAHLAAARNALSDMRTRTEALVNSDAAGDAFSSEMLAKALFRRMEQLLDDGTTPLFFGRLDYATDPHLSQYAGETFHVGRRHVTDAVGEPMVVDWRAPVSTAFYQASASEPAGLQRRRRFGFDRGTLTSFEDEHLIAGEETGLASRLLTEEIERPRVGPMRDIVATIQPDQDALVRADLDNSLCVQGAPGTGKTAVGLHRVAYLLYAYPEQLRRAGVLVVGPNSAFLNYISQVLPALGEADVKHLTIDNVTGIDNVRGIDNVKGQVAVTAVDDPAATRVKGDARMATVLANALTAGFATPSAPIVLTEPGVRLRLGPGELGAILGEVHDGYESGIPYATSRDRMALQIAERFRRQRERRGGAPSDSWVRRVARSKAVREWLDLAWPAVDPAGLVNRVLTDPHLLAAASDGILSADEQAVIIRPVRRRPNWTAADAVLIDEVAGQLERVPGFGHVLVDEAQDLSPMQARAIARRSRHGSLTVLGDLAQGTATHAASDWPTLLAHLGKSDTPVTPLTTGYRMPAEIVDFANRLLPDLATGVAPATSMRRAAGALEVRSAPNLDEAVIDVVTNALAQPGSVAIISADAMESGIAARLSAAGVPVVNGDASPAADGKGPDQPVTVLAASLAKGLEFDTVIVVEPAAIVAAEPRGLNRLYVVLTRAVSRLIVLHTQPLPAELF